MKNKNRICLYVITGLFLLSPALKTSAQDYLISFAGTGASTTVSSVIAGNLTQCTTVTLNAGDVLHLGTVGINETDVNENSMHIFPNPMTEQSELSFFAKQAGNVLLAVYDISGKKVLQIRDRISLGIQRFQLIGLQQGMYFINIRGDGYFYKAKLISLNPSQSEVIIRYVGNEKHEAVTGTLKSTSSTVNMAYTTGDLLLFKGVSGNYKTVVTDIPSGDTTITFNFAACTDFDNNNYSVVQTGTQMWMAENLKTTHFSDGTTLVDGTGAGDIYGDYTTKYWFVYNDSMYYKDTYGLLYTWAAVMNGASSSDANPSGVQGICPSGWHVPGDAEWKQMEMFLGMSQPEADAFGLRGTNEGGKLKETCSEFWISPNSGATDSTGFTALPGGNRNDNGTFNDLGSNGYWWSATGYDASYAWSRSLVYDYAQVVRFDYGKSNGFSIRCTRDY